MRAIADVALGGHVEMAAILIASSCSPSPKYPRYWVSFNSDNFEIFRHLRATFFKMAAQQRKPIAIFLHRILPLLPMNICTKFHQFLQSSFWDIKLFMFRCILAAILKMATILKILNSRCTTTLGAYRYCEVSLRSVQPSLRSSTDKIIGRRRIIRNRRKTICRSRRVGATLYNCWLLMRLTSWFINPGNVIFTEATAEVNITFPGLINQEVNRFQKSIIVLLNYSKMPLIMHSNAIVL